MVAFWRAKNSLENNVSHFSINNTVYERSVGRRKKSTNAKRETNLILGIRNKRLET